MLYHNNDEGMSVTLTAYALKYINKNGSDAATMTWNDTQIWELRIHGNETCCLLQQGDRAEGVEDG